MFDRRAVFIIAKQFDNIGRTRTLLCALYFRQSWSHNIVFAIFVLVQMLKPHTEKLALIAGGMAISGAISGATLVSFIYFRSEMENNGFDTATIQSLQTLLKQVYIVIVFMPLPGLFFPIGLLILSIGLLLKNIVPRLITITLVSGAMLFPFGRISENSIIVVISDFLFVISLSYTSWQVFGSTVNLKKKLDYSQVYKTSGKVL